MTRPQSYADVVEVIERWVDEAQRRALRSTTDPERGLPRFKKKAEQAQDDRVLHTLLQLLAEVCPDLLTPERLKSASYQRIDGDAITADDTRIRRRLQGIPEKAPDLRAQSSHGGPE